MVGFVLVLEVVEVLDVVEEALEVLAAVEEVLEVVEEVAEEVLEVVEGVLEVVVEVLLPATIASRSAVPARPPATTAPSRAHGAPA